MPQYEVKSRQQMWQCYGLAKLVLFAASFYITSQSFRTVTDLHGKTFIMEKNSDNKGDNVYHRGKKTKVKEWWCRNATSHTLYTSHLQYIVLPAI